MNNNEVLTQENDALTQENDALTQENDALTQENDALTQENDALTQENDALTQENEDLFQCRICLENEENINLLISPCKCKGTSKYVHRSCLRRWRYQDRNAPGFHKCMECNGNYIILNSSHNNNDILDFDTNNSNNNNSDDNLEIYNLFSGLDTYCKILSFQLIISFFLFIFIHVITYYGNINIGNMFPQDDSENSIVNIINNQILYRNLFYLNFALYIQNLLFMSNYLLKCIIYIKNKQKFYTFMFNYMVQNVLYYNGYWIIDIFILLMGFTKFAIILMSIYQGFSYKINYILINKHNIAIRIINNRLNIDIFNQSPNIVIDESYDDIIIEPDNINMGSDDINMEFDDINMESDDINNVHIQLLS
jgi:hypothetical protein